jgi:hypothetical protein
MSKGRSYKRGGVFRDSRRFLIFTEGAKREVRYFEAVGVDERRVSVLIFGADPIINDSSPEQTLARAIAQIKKSPLMEDDRVWLVIDKDRWSEKQLMLVQRSCNDKGWNLAITNPCFELWLYLHYAELPEGNTSSCQQLKTALGELTIPEGYQPEIALKGIDDAIRRAKVLDENPDLVIPPRNVSRIYLLFEDLKDFLV